MWVGVRGVGGWAGCGRKGRKGMVACIGGGEGVREGVVLVRPVVEGVCGRDWEFVLGYGVGGRARLRAVHTAGHF